MARVHPLAPQARMEATLSPSDDEEASDTEN
jgi:hypothetical protein